MFGLIPDTKTEVDKLRDLIANKRLETANPRSYFVPDAVLDDLLTPELVESVVEEIGVNWEVRDGVVKSVLSNARKIFCILVWIEGLNLKSIGEIVHRKDEELPFAVEKVGRKFWEAQWEYLSPVFDGIYHALDRNIILPFRSERVCARDGNGILSKVEVYDIHQRTLGSLKKRYAGAQGKVQYGAGGTIDPNEIKGPVVVDVIQKQLLEGEEPFQVNLDSLQSIGKLVHPHIVDILGAHSHMGFHYVIFPCADMDLVQFLDLHERHADFVTDHSFYTSIVGLSEALNAIHSYNSMTMNDVEPSIGYHYDIKPQSILVQGGKFLLPNFGLQGAGSRNLGATTYDSPESSDPSTPTTGSRRSTHIWSFGCILSEIATYMISGRQGVQEFIAMRRTKYPNDSFHDSGALKPEVDAWIYQLEEKTSPEGPLFHFLQVIKEMLQCDIEKRPDISGVLTHLRKDVTFQIFIEPLKLKPKRSHGNDWWEELKHELKLCSEPVVRLLLEKKKTVGPNYRDRNGWTILDHAAAIDGSGSMAHLFLKEGVCSGFSTEALSIALCKAGRNCGGKAVSLLIDEGADLNHKDTNGFTVLEEASYKGKTEIAQLVLEKETDQKFTTKGLSIALCWASKCGNEKVVGLLLEKGADVNFVSESGMTALRWAVAMYHISVARLLLDAGADVNHCFKSDSAMVWEPADEPMTPDEKNAYQKYQFKKELKILERAGRKKDVGMTSLLLEKRAYPGVLPEDVSNVMCLASRNGKEAFVRLLLEKAIDGGYMSEEGYKALVQAAFGGHLAVARALLEKGVDPNHEGDGVSALRIALIKQHESVVCFLLENRADPNSMNPSGLTALEALVQNEKWKMAYLLLDKAIDPKVSVQSLSAALITAASNADEKFISLLLEKGADPKHQNANENTALIFAAIRGHLAIVQLLLDKGADAKHQNKFANTALHLATSNGHLTVVQLLLEAGGDPSHKSDNGSTALTLSWKYPEIRKLLKQNHIGKEKNESEPKKS